MDQYRIFSYLRRQLRSESEFAASYDVGPYARLAYRRALELRWTLSRLLGFQTAATRADVDALDRPHPAIDFEVAPFQSEAPRIYIDVTDLLTCGKKTGIQRVAYEIARHAAQMGLAAPVCLSDGRFALVSDSGQPPALLDCRPGDILFLADAGWNHVDKYPAALESFQSAGGRIVAGIYDLMPLTYPTLYPLVQVADFQAWISLLFKFADAAVAISKTTAESYAAFSRASNTQPREGFQLGWWRLGADLVEHLEEPGRVARKVAQNPFFLSVGTVEVRKGYPVVLEAFETLWAKGGDAQFVIAGRPGWNAVAFEERLRMHPEQGRRLHWLDNASDADLCFLYRNARAVIMASFAEGFGLPVVEALRLGALVIASDIPVFHEIAGDGVVYFNVLDPDSLAVRIREALESPKRAPKIEHVSWQDSTNELMTMLTSGAYQMTLSR